MTRHHGYRSKTRSVFRKSVRNRGLPSLGKFMVKYEVGDTVDIIVDPSFQKKGMPHRRFQGKTGKITGVRGRCFEVSVKDGNKPKILFVGQEHFRMNTTYLQTKEQQASA